MALGGVPWGVFIPGVVLVGVMGQLFTPWGGSNGDIYSWGEPTYSCGRCWGEVICPQGAIKGGYLPQGGVMGG